MSYFSAEEWYVFRCGKRVSVQEMLYRLLDISPSAKPHLTGGKLFCSKLPREEDPSICDNYRGISSLSEPYKREGKITTADLLSPRPLRTREGEEDLRLRRGEESWKLSVKKCPGLAVNEVEQRSRARQG
ncbi:hypothetical protein ACROYT_G016038 [Oculina patagonica]